ncbi:MAG: SMC-Scp complex subunit ScpB [Candidatus Omnitrophica bacterium]|nr:SMC-Scp complex subunit ScpB [Candidatus Omnitrophota bacterium]
MRTNAMDKAAKEKEKAEKIKKLRKELESDLEEQLLAAKESSGEADSMTRVEVEKVNVGEVVDPEKARDIIEALLFAASKPMPVNDIRRVVRGLTPKQVETIIKDLKDTYTAQNRSFEIVEIAGGYEIVTRKEFAPWLMKLELQKKVKQATQSALETLAILAYKQPITRAEIEELRGVDVSGVMTTLVERGLIKIVGKKDVPGRPFLYGTTDKFLEHFGLGSLRDLPNLDEIKMIVDYSVKKEDLLKQPQLVDVPAEDSEESGENVSQTDVSEPQDSAVENLETTADEDSSDEPLVDENAPDDSEKETVSGS